MHFLAIAIAAVAGSMVALQAPINSALGKHTSVLGATVVSFAIGLATAILVALGRGQLDGLAKAAEAPWWQLTGGILGAIFVALAITLVPKIGAMQFAAAAVMGQIIMSLVVDHYGWLGVPAHAASWERVLAVPLIGVALWLSRR
ncbi:MAG: DMT family transporter [Myxococcales bacterium]|nr:DMT family transporter [Myxococcales bacterium]